MVAREEYRAVAARGSILYFLIVEMSNVNVMYQNSLKQFLIIFDNSITKWVSILVNLPFTWLVQCYFFFRSAKSCITEDRIINILDYLTHEVWVFTTRSLYERHKPLFTLMLAMKIDLHKGIINHEEFLTFIKGGASLDLNAVQPKPFKWILDVTWLNLVEISKLPTFHDILPRVSGSPVWGSRPCRSNVWCCCRLKGVKESGGFGTRKRSQKRKNYRVVIRDNWMYSESLYWSDHGVQIEHYHKLASTSWVSRPRRAAGLLHLTNFILFCFGRFFRTSIRRSLHPWFGTNLGGIRT